METCGVIEGAFEVHRETGVSFRVSGEARLCFECGPDGGVYHPDRIGIFHRRRTAGEPVRRITRAEAMAWVRARAAEVDPIHNHFEVHSHHVNGKEITHAHTDGSEMHRHPDAGWATFELTKAERQAYRFGNNGPEELPAKPAPFGPDMEYVEPTAEERLFRVTGEYRYTNPSSIKDRKPTNADWTRKAWRESMDLIVRAARLRLYGHEPLVIGPGAVPMTALRMATRYRMTPVYEILGWRPTPYLGLPPWPTADVEAVP